VLGRLSILDVDGDVLQATCASFEGRLYASVGEYPWIRCFCCTQCSIDRSLPPGRVPTMPFIVLLIALCSFCDAYQKYMLAMATPLAAFASDVHELPSEDTFECQFTSPTICIPTILICRAESQSAHVLLCRRTLPLHHFLYL
jgi:hypothetical protein